MNSSTHFAIWTSSSWNSNIAWFSPSCSPWVLYNPVGVSVANQQNSMINSAVTWAWQNASCISAPWRCTDGDSNRVFLEKIDYLIVIQVIVVKVWLCSLNKVYFLADSIVRGIGVVRILIFSFDTIRGLCHNIFHISSVTWTGSCTFQKVLFRNIKIECLCLFINFSWLKTSCSCESPAWSTASLILHRCNNIWISPIQAWWIANFSIHRWGLLSLGCFGEFHETVCWII